MDRTSPSLLKQPEDPVDFVQKYIRELENQVSFFKQIPDELLKNIRSFEYKKYSTSKKICIKYAVKYHKSYRSALKCLRKVNSIATNVKLDESFIRDEHNIEISPNSFITKEHLNNSELSAVNKKFNQCNGLVNEETEEVNSLNTSSTAMTNCSTSNLYNDSTIRVDTSLDSDLDTNCIITTEFSKQCNTSSIDETFTNDLNISSTKRISSDTINVLKKTDIHTDESFASNSAKVINSDFIDIEHMFVDNSYHDSNFNTGKNGSLDKNGSILSEQSDSIITVDSTESDCNSSLEKNLISFDNSMVKKQENYFSEEKIDSSVFEDDFMDNYDTFNNVCEKKTSALLESNLNKFACDPSQPQLNTVGHKEEFSGNYPHTDIMYDILHSKFGLQCFRPLQEEIINASLAQHDCFILMPTGGGKSLCYQLPAIMVPGVTVVISPLRSLILDQVAKMNALDIPAAHLCPELSKTSNESLVIARLQTKEPTIKLLYLTPEKIMLSRNILDLLKSLYERDKLSCFVIDEAHCLSQWGHDFRADYKKLACLRNKFPMVPIMCLTATATKVVQTDVIKTLQLQNVKTFISSFNRPNIKYQVLPKNSNTIKEIAKLICDKFSGCSGIIYCFCRKDCEKIAFMLCKFGIKAAPYHAGMNKTVLEKNQTAWMQDKINVITATIAFGMGIDKPDVRFVIHHAIPKSVEAFYQESGRAGRDGEISYSYLFYSYSDVIKMQRLIVGSQSTKSANRTVLEGHLNNLHQMAVFCENKIDCRRYLQLIHLGEKFDRNECIRNSQTTCDNCLNRSNYENVDFTSVACDLARIVKDLTAKEKKVTLLNILEVYKGTSTKKIMEKGYKMHPLFGKGTNANKSDIHRILKEMVFKKILLDECVPSVGEFPITYVKIGPKFKYLETGNAKIELPIQKHPTVENNSSNLNIQTNSSSRNDISKVPSNVLLRIKRRCHEELLDVCQQLALENSVTLSSIMNLSAIKKMADVLPKDKEEILKIEHVTEAIYKKYGKRFLEVTIKYNQELEKEGEKYENKNHKAELMFSAFDDDFAMEPTTSTKRKLPFKRQRPRKKARKTKTTKKKK